MSGDEDEDKFDTIATDLPTCPHCGAVFEDYTDFEDGSVYECDKCGGSFLIEVEHETTFTTFKG